MHLLDKPISFDDAQRPFIASQRPWCWWGSAGSGKTALTLEKLKHAEGEVLYVTHSAFWRKAPATLLYYANGFEHTDQEAVFLSYREFIETIRRRRRAERKWRDFAAWFDACARVRAEWTPIRRLKKFGGVIAAAAEGVLSV